MAEARLTAVVDTKGAAKAERELRAISKTAKVVDINTGKATTSVKSFGKNASAAIAAIDGPLGGVSSRVSALTTLFTQGSFAVTSFAVAAAGAAAAIGKGVFELDKLNVALAKSQALITATGGAAGFTAEQLQEQAQATALVTLASTEQIQKAQAILQTFDKVSSDTFTRAIGLAQDLATVYGGDAASQATQLGKALQDPIKGITALNRVGVTFSDTQKEQIENFVKGGEVAKAQEVILSNLASQVGGAGAAVASGTLAGAFDTTGQVYTEFVAKLASSTGVYENLISLVNTFNDGLIGLSNDLDANSSDRVQELVKERQALEAELKGFGDLGSLPVFGSLFGPSQAEAKVLKDQIAGINAEIGKIQDVNKAKLKAESDAQKQGEQRQKEIAVRDKAAAETAEKEKADARLQIQKDAAQRQLEVFTNLNNTELEAIDAKEQQRLDKLKSFSALELEDKKLLETAKTEIELAAQTERDELAQRQRDKEKTRLEDATKEQRAAIKSLSDGLIDAAANGESLGDSLISTVRGISTSIIKAGVDAFIQEQLISKLSGAAFTAEKAAEVGTTVAQAGLNAFAATAAIPVVGPALAPGAAAAATSAAGAIGSTVIAASTARYQGGNVAAGQSTTFAEQGELEILTPSSSSRIRTKQQMQQLMGQGESNSPQINVVNINQSSRDLDITSEANDRGELIQTIRDVVSGDAQEPNSQITKGLTNGLDVSVRR